MVCDACSPNFWKVERLKGARRNSVNPLIEISSKNNDSLYKLDVFRKHILHFQGRQSLRKSSLNQSNIQLPFS